MAEEKKKKHDLRDGLPPSVSIDTQQEHSVLDAERKRRQENNEVGPNWEQTTVPEGQNNKQGA